MVSALEVKKLREDTGVGMMDCKKALEESNGDFDKAKDILRKLGLQKAGSRGHKIASNGTIGVYRHIGGRICSMVEVKCETDFVARSEEFQNFAHNIAMHIAAVGPKWLSIESVPCQDSDKEIEYHKASVLNKPTAIQDKILSGKMDKFYKDNCLLEQTFVKDDTVTVKEYLMQFALVVKENIVITKFNRLEVGE